MEFEFAKGTQHSWHKLVGSANEHVQEVCGRAKIRQEKWNETRKKFLVEGRDEREAWGVDKRGGISKIRRNDFCVASVGLREQRREI